MFVFLDFYYIIFHDFSKNYVKVFLGCNNDKQTYYISFIVFIKEVRYH